MILARMNKKHRILIEIALVLLFAGIALATSSASSVITIYAFDQNPVGSGEEKIYISCKVNLIP